MKPILRFLLALFFLAGFAAAPLRAQLPDTSPNNAAMVSQVPATSDTAVFLPAEAKKAAIPRPMSLMEARLSTGLLVFAVVVLLIITLLIRMQKLEGAEMVKFVLITLIIISTLYLITAGYSNDQIAPEIGLLGTIAGYLLGKSGINDKPSSNTNSGSNGTATTAGGGPGNDPAVPPVTPDPLPVVPVTSPAAPVQPAV